MVSSEALTILDEISNSILELRYGSANSINKSHSIAHLHNIKLLYCQALGYPKDVSAYLGYDNEGFSSLERVVLQIEAIIADTELYHNFIPGYSLRHLCRIFLKQRINCPMYPIGQTRTGAL